MDEFEKIMQLLNMIEPAESEEDANESFNNGEDILFANLMMDMIEGFMGGGMGGLMGSGMESLFGTNPFGLSNKLMGGVHAQDAQLHFSTPESFMKTYGVYQNLKNICFFNSQEKHVLKFYSWIGYKMINRLSNLLDGGLPKNIKTHFEKQSPKVFFEMMQYYKDVKAGGYPTKYKYEMDMSSFESCVREHFKMAEIINGLNNKFKLPHDVVLYRGRMDDESNLEKRPLLTPGKFASTSMELGPAVLCCFNSMYKNNDCHIDKIIAKKGTPFIAVPHWDALDLGEESGEAEVLLFKDKTNVKFIKNETHPDTSLLTLKMQVLEAGPKR